MKTKYTKENEIDFYYTLLVYKCNNIGVGITDEKLFATRPNDFTEYRNSTLHDWHRETSLETYEYYVSTLELKAIKNNSYVHANLETNKDWYAKHKIKITICEED